MNNNGNMNNNTYIIDRDVSIKYNIKYSINIIPIKKMIQT